MGKQDVDSDIALSFEINCAEMTLVMNNFDNPAIDNRDIAARQIGKDIRRNLMTIGENSDPGGPIPE